MWPVAERVGSVRGMRGSRVKQALLSAVYTLPLPLRRRALYAFHQRRVPNFRQPALFTEKVNWRILNDRRENIAWTCDKLRVKEHAASFGVATPKTLWSGTDVRELRDVDLPANWVLKPNHRSGLVHFGHGPAEDIRGLQQLTADWLGELQGEELGEWAYTQARPLLLAEEMLGDGVTAPSDYRFFTFDGVPRYVQVEFDAHGAHSRSFYTADWQMVDAVQVYPKGEPIEQPKNYGEMLRVAGEIGSAFDFVRVDLYNIDGDIYLGEVTPYPTGGLMPFRPRSFDRELGACWTLPA